MRQGCCAGVPGQLQANVSIFQSLPDAVLQQQTFAVAPIARRGSPQEPESSAQQEDLGYKVGDTLELLDATCDSDGVMHAILVSTSPPGGEGPLSKGVFSSELDQAASGVRNIAASLCPQNDALGRCDHGSNDFGLVHDCGDPLRWPQGAEGTAVLAVLNTGAYQDALASHHNLFGQPETWYVAELPATGTAPMDGELDCAQGELEEWACRVAAARDGLELPPGWSKARGTWLQAAVTVSRNHAYLAAVRQGESVVQVLQAAGMAVSEKRLGLGYTLTYCSAPYQRPAQGGSEDL